MRTKMAVDLTVARRQLGEALGDFSQTYWNNMKLWYKQKISKEEFDTQAKKCLGNDNIHFHNDFLLAILAKCQALGATPASHPRTPQKLAPKPQLIKKGKIKKPKKVLKANFEQRFTPCDPLQGAPELSLKELSEESEIGLCTYDMMLPDTATIYGRLFLGAWDAGLDNVADDTVSLMLHATEHLVKDILTVCCSTRSSFRLKDGHFRYAIGSTYPRLHLRNSTSPWPPNSERQEKTNGLHFPLSVLVIFETSLSLSRKNFYLSGIRPAGIIVARENSRHLAKLPLGPDLGSDTTSDVIFAGKLVLPLLIYSLTLSHRKEIKKLVVASRDVGFFLRLGMVDDAGIPKSESVGNSNNGRTLEQAEAEAAVTIASSDSRVVSNPPISLMDLRDALQVHRRVIPSHTVYSANIERTLANMCHPSNDELEQNQLHKLEARRRYERLKQQRSLRL
ncbi:unnamed protein product [Porites evermanni]|uniref:Transcriptional adapter 1 n=1 Tax=Porites evermanni TaxID=104178 RepID=A0ABN8M837_9CNID|nr:unnamed protein product [Porites evermanni]